VYYFIEFLFCATCEYNFYVIHTFATPRIDLHDTSIPCNYTNKRSGDLKPIGLSLLCIEGSREPTVGPLLTEGVCNVTYRRSFVCPRWTRHYAKEGRVSLHSVDYRITARCPLRSLWVPLTTAVAEATSHPLLKTNVTTCKIVFGSQCIVYVRLHKLMTNVEHTRARGLPS